MPGAPADDALPPTTDGLVTLRPSRPQDAPALVSGRDDESRRWLGPGAAEPRPTACIWVDDEIVGWIDYDAPRPWLGPGEVNVGYAASTDHRGRGYVTRAVQLLAHHLSVTEACESMTVLIRPENHRSLAVATRAGFVEAGTVDGSVLLRRPVPPCSYTDGVVTIRPQEASDLEMDLSAKDDAQIDWLWLPGQRESWEAMTPAQRRAHAAQGLAANAARFVAGPTWSFAVDGPGAPYVAYVDADLANPHVPRGEANISYTAHPEHRGRGHVSRAVRLLLRFLAEHTGARTAHLVVDADNEPSLRVARAVGASAVERWADERGRTMIRHVRSLELDL